MSDESTLPLASEFPASTREDWLRLVTAALKGGNYEDRLFSRTYDGLRIEPLYAAARDARPLATRTTDRPWEVMQRIELPDPAIANREALHELENGATGLSLVFAGATGAHGFGIETTEVALRRTLDGVHLDAGIAIELGVGPEWKDAPRFLAALVRAHDVSPEATDIRFGLDPLGAIATSGVVETTWPEIGPLFAKLIGELKSQGFNGPFAAADGRPVHAAGGSEAQELAFALSAAVAYLRALEGGGIGLGAARKMIFFRLAADTGQFLTIAKFRALRKLWGRVEAACGLTPEPIFVSGTTAWRMMAKRDPWVNLLRTTIATFSAGIGGANAITALPFTAALGLPDRFARRLARNLQLILLEESNLAKVMDPAAGSGGIEALTDQLCAAAWTLFQEIEAAGGLFATLKSGMFQRKVAEARAAREAAVARRKDALTGATEFPNIHELPVSVLDTSPAASPTANPTVEPLRPIRLAEPFEHLRDASDRSLARDGARPIIFLANLGNPADFTARATFAKNFFEAGGIEAVSNDGFTNSKDSVLALKASGALLVCLCSSDGVYATKAAESARALASAGVRHIYLAGRPREQDALKAAGVGTFVYAGCDALATLKAAHGILGLEPEPKR